MGLTSSGGISRSMIFIALLKKVKDGIVDRSCRRWLYMVRIDCDGTVL